MRVKLTQPAEQIHFTKAGYRKLQQEYDSLVTERPMAVEHLKRARELGDLSENGYYKASRQKLSFLDHRIREITHILKHAVFSEAPSANTISIGTQVTLKEGKGTQTYEIVGDYEADPLAHKLSQRSPLGAALIGKQRGASITITVPSGKRSFTVLSIRDVNEDTSVR